MTRKILAAVALSCSAIGAIGCAQPHLQAKIDQLNRDQEDLLREKARAEADLLAARAQLEAYQRSRPAGPEPVAPPKPAVVEEAPLPELGAELDIRRRGNETVINLPNDVFFSSGSSALSREGDRSMRLILDYLRRRHPTGLIRIEGHSDSDPISRTKSKYHCNWELSFERAHAVAHYLVDKGRIEAVRLVCEAHGEHHPAHPTDKAKNRRVEIVIAR
jgi:flagellar motor protein MotB